MTHYKIKFIADFDDSIEIYAQKGIDFKIEPNVGECVYVNGFYHRVIDVVHDPIQLETTLHLGQSAQTACESRGKGYGLWNS